MIGFKGNVTATQENKDFAQSKVDKIEFDIQNLRSGLS